MYNLFREILDRAQNEGVYLLSIDLQYFSMSSEKTNSFNGVNTQTLGTVFSSMQNQPEMAKVTFSVKSQWNSGFSVETTASKRFRVGGQNIERNTEHKTQYDFPAQISGEDWGPTVCEGCMGALGSMFDTNHCSPCYVKGYSARWYQHRC